MLKHLVADINGVTYHQQLKKGRFFRAGYQNKSKGAARRSKDYYLRKHGAQKALELAIEKRQEWENEFGANPIRENAIEAQKDNRVYENKFKIRDNYFILRIKHTEKIVIREYKIGIKYLDDVMDEHWHLNLNKSSARTRINGELVTLRKFLYPDKEGVINHINRDKFDYREENVTFESSSNYISSRTYEETEQAPAGVHFYVDNDNHKMWIASFEKDNYTKKRSFSVSKWGTENSKSRAIEQREEWEWEYNRGILHD